MRWIRFAVLICLATIIQASFLSKFNLRPNLLIILFVFFAIYNNTTEAIISSFTIGFAADLIGTSMGSQMLCFGILGTSLSYLTQIIAMRKMPYQAIAIFVITILAGVLTNMLNSFKNIPAQEFGLILRISIYSAVAGPFLFIPSAWWMRIKTQRYKRR